MMNENERDDDSNDDDGGSKCQFFCAPVLKSRTSDNTNENHFDSPLMLAFRRFSLLSTHTRFVLIVVRQLNHNRMFYIIEFIYFVLSVCLSVGVLNVWYVTYPPTTYNILRNEVTPERLRRHIIDAIGIQLFVRGL